MQCWIKTGVYPVVHVDRQRNKISIYQKLRNIRDTHNIYNPASMSCWWTFITYTTRYHMNFTDATSQYWLTPERNKLSIIMNDDDEFIILNLKQIG